MATRFVAPPFRDRGRDLVVKVKYNGTLKRFNAHVNGSQFDHSLVALRSKIASAFKFSSDVEFILTYTDEDGDVVMLDDENDLRDAAINQKLNPLRIDIQLKNDNIKAPRTKHQALNSRSLRSTTLEDQLVHVKSAIDEAMKFVPEQVPAVLTKLSHDLRSRAASSVPSLAELLDRLATLMTPKGNAEASSGHAYGSSCSSSGGPEASRNTKIEHENKLMTGSASQSPDMQTAPGLKSVLPEDPEAQVEQAPVYHSVDSLKFTGSLGNKSHRKGSTIAESMVRRASQSKGKSATPSAVPPVSSSTYTTTPIQHTPATFVRENKLRYCPTYGHNGLLVIIQKADSHLGIHTIMEAWHNLCSINGYNVMAVEQHPFLGLVTSLMYLNFQYPNYSEAFARFQKPIILKEPEPASSTLTSIPAADKQAQILTTDHHASSSGPAFTLMASAMPAPETIPLPEYISFAVPVSASGVPAPASLPVQTPSSVSTAVLPDDTINHKEEKLLRELEELGFGQADLNKEIIRQNKYDLEQSVRDLSGLSDWDPLLGELAELMNKEAVAEGSGGSIKGLVMNLVARAKKDR
ncbi:hypothetical protein PR202_gb15286 [Eleusine coracana subsp. coracana]|uniref:PB1 domain-containing protein n=1 Tax=Eleusine coracana subsp. coracana TaxID=191504 RepID=A0AAV5EXZ7_ELECO|nr:hypothetical protein PR202_gb15286 [Eleusine coracana subsp. coracana]